LARPDEARALLRALYTRGWPAPRSRGRHPDCAVASWRQRSEWSGDREALRGAQCDGDAFSPAPTCAWCRNWGWR